MLRRVATTLRERCRATDVLVRYGGEEFLLCFPNTDLREACLICEELRGAIEGGHGDEDFMALYLALREAARESTGAGERR